jgi:hypothetical protein
MPAKVSHPLWRMNTSRSIDAAGPKAPPDHFPQTFLELAKTTMLNGATVNGVAGPLWELRPATDSERA